MLALEKINARQSLFQEIKYPSDSETKITVKLFRKKKKKSILILRQLKGRHGLILL